MKDARLASMVSEIHFVFSSKTVILLQNLVILNFW